MSLLPRVALASLVMSGAACSGDSSTTGSGGSGTTGSTGAETSATGTPASTGVGGASSSASGTSTASTSSGPPHCNPITQVPCDVANGDACDSAGRGVYECYPGPNDVPVCGDCDAFAGKFCQAGNTCLAADAMGNTQCFRYCCTDADCGGGQGACDTTLTTAPVGVCGKPMGGGTYMTPACTGLPATPPSMGACVP